MVINRKKYPTSTGMQAVHQVEKGEQTEHINIHKFNWEEFWHLFFGWLISAVVIVIVLIALTMAEKSENLVIDVILRLDTLSLTFSLVLSAGLEQVWNNKKHWKYKLTQYAELTLALIGLVLYLTYSLMMIFDENNPYLLERFNVHLLYVIVSTLVVIGGFVARAFPDKE